MVGAGNDRQFQTLANSILERPDLAQDPRFQTNGLRVKHRVELVAEISMTLEQEGRDVWLEKFTGKG
jgi:succinate---hydroxymethylglutarate CoA-transferase